MSWPSTTAVFPPTAWLVKKGEFFYDGRESGVRAGVRRRALNWPGTGALEDATAYAPERHQFGRLIAEFQAICFKPAEMATEVEVARQLLYFVCNGIDQGRCCDEEASMVKLFISEMSGRVASEALQV